jgi:hypothetical protein
VFSDAGPFVASALRHRAAHFDARGRIATLGGSLSVVSENLPLP